VKSPIQRRAAIAALLLAPALTACGFSAQTDQVYQPAVGVNDRSGSVEILNALVVSGTDGTGTFAGTLVNENQTQDDVLESVSGPGITAPRSNVTIKAGDHVSLAQSGALILQGSSIKPGTFVDLTFSFGSGQSTTLKVPVVTASGDFADVPLSASPSASPSKAPKTPKSSPSSTASSTGSSSASPSASPSAQ
jgi:hypothetical protein